MHGYLIFTSDTLCPEVERLFANSPLLAAMINAILSGWQNILNK